VKGIEKGGIRDQTQIEIMKKRGVEQNIFQKEKKGSPEIHKGICFLFLKKISIYIKRPYLVTKK
jgi:hypothetical protein